MNQFYNSAITALLEGTLDLDDAPLTVAAWWGCYFNSNDTNLSDVYGNAVATPPVLLQNTRVVGRTLEANPVTFTAIPEAETIEQLILHDGATGALVGYIDQRPDLAPIFVQGNGGPVTFTWGGTNGSVVISL